MKIMIFKFLTIMMMKMRILMKMIMIQVGIISLIMRERKMIYPTISVAVGLRKEEEVLIINIARQY